MDPLKASMNVSGSGLALQTLRMRIISENIANAQVSPTRQGETPYQRKFISFASEYDRALQAHTVKLNRIEQYRNDFRLVYDPEHIAADERGMVKMPNIEMLIELGDMRETLRSYEANMQTMRQAREMISMTIGMMNT